MIVSFVWLNFIKYYFITGEINIDEVFKWLGVSGLIIYIVLRSLKKYTGILNVDGR